MNPDRKIKLFIDKRPDGIVQPDRSFAANNHSDFYITISLFKSSRLVDDYVETFIDPFRATVNRQLINPFFIELGFFEKVDSVNRPKDGNYKTKEENTVEAKAEIYKIEILEE